MKYTMTEQWISGAMKLYGISRELAEQRWSMIEKNIHNRGYKFLKPKK